MCLADWPDIHVVKDDLIAPDKALEHMSDFFAAVARSATDAKTREKGQNGLCCIKNLVKYMADVPTSQNRGKKITGRLNAAGALLNVLALDWGMASDVKGMTFTKCRESYGDAKPTMASVAWAAAEAYKAPAPVSERKPTPGMKPVVAPMLTNAETPVKDPETLREEELQKHLKTLRELKERLQAALDCITLGDNGKPSEIMRGVCDKAGMIEIQALRVVDACTALAVAAPTQDKEEID